MFNLYSMLILMTTYVTSLIDLDSDVYIKLKVIYYKIFFLYTVKNAFILTLFFLHSNNVLNVDKKMLFLNTFFRFKI